MLLGSSSLAEHIQHLQNVFERFRVYGSGNPIEFKFGLSHVDILGHRIDKNGIKPLPGRIDAYSLFPVLKL